jgi:hypothetical protein
MVHYKMSRRFGIKKIVKSTKLRMRENTGILSILPYAKKGDYLT